MSVDLLQAGRLSILKDGQTGMESRDQEVRAWAAAKGHNIVATAAEHVSGEKNPFKRKKLGLHLTDPDLIVQYQGIVAAEVDRFSRDAHNLNELKDWCAANGKTLFVVNPPLCWPVAKNDPLRMVYQIQWELLAILAEAERLATSQRYTNMKNFLKSNGAVWGRVGFGLTSTGKAKSKTVAPTGEGRIYVPRIYAMCIDGKSCDVIAAWLTAQGAETYKHRLWAAKPADSDRGPEPHNVWSGTTVRQIIRNPAYRGIVCERNWAAKAGTYGAKILECEALVDAATWQRANDALAVKNGQKRKPSALDPAMLHSGVLRCLDCGGPMYRITTCGTRWKTRADGTRVRYKQNGPDYYRCRGGKPGWKGCGNLIQTQQVDETLDWWMSANHGQIYVKTIIRGHIHEIELAEIAYQMQQLSVQGLTDEEFDAEMARLRAERDRVKALPEEPDRVESVPTGETYSSRWTELPPAERSPWLKKMGKHFCAGKTHIELRDADGSLLEVIPFAQVNQARPEPASVTGTTKRPSL